MKEMCGDIGSKAREKLKSNMQTGFEYNLRTCSIKKLIIIKFKTFVIPELTKGPFSQ